jgi:hypothetical protein
MAIYKVVEAQFHQYLGFSTRLPPYPMHVSYCTLHILTHELLANTLHVCSRYSNDPKKALFIAFRADTKNFPSDRSIPKPSTSGVPMLFSGKSQAQTMRKPSQATTRLIYRLRTIK